MHLRCCCTLAVAIAFGGYAVAQPATLAADNTSCSAEKAGLEKRMEVARAKGQMLLRRQLADQLAGLQTGCKPQALDQSRAANIEKLEKKIQALRAELETAEEQLRELKSEGNR